VQRRRSSGVSSIATFHHAAGVANPCETQAIKLALKRTHRGRGRAQAQAAPVNDVLVAACSRRLATRIGCLSATMPYALAHRRIADVH
jgi:hypothetical protein